MGQALMLLVGGICVFAVAVLAMIKIMPAPLKDSDYLVIGSVAMLVSLLVVFLVLIATRFKTSNLFFKKRKKPR